LRRGITQYSLFEVTIEELGFLARCLHVVEVDWMKKEVIAR